MTEFKVGDGVVCDGFKFSSRREFKGVRYIEKITDIAIFINGIGYHEYELKLVFPYNLQKGEEIYCSDSKGEPDKECAIMEFYAYDPSLKRPFLTIENDDDVSSWRFAKPLPKYKAYTEPKLEWITNPKRKIKNIQTGKSYLIQGIKKTDNYVIEVYKDDGVGYITMPSLRSNYVWLEDNTPCGEPIN